MINKMKTLYKDEKGSATVAIKGLVLVVFVTLMMFVIIDFYYLATVYRYVKDQQELANRAVYAELDIMSLADRDVYIDEVLGRQKFQEYLTKNLELSAGNVPGKDIRIVGSVIIKDFQIYNTAELPVVTPKGKTINLVSVYSEIEVQIEPFLVGKFGPVTLQPSMTTYIPDILIKTFHP